MRVSDSFGPARRSALARARRLEVARDIESDLHFGIAVQHFAAMSAMAGDGRRAHGCSATAMASTAAPKLRELTEEREYRRVLASISQTVPAEELQREIARGASLAQPDAFGEALLV